MKDLFAVMIRFSLLPVLLLISAFAFLIHLVSTLIELIQALLDLILDFLESTLVLMADMLKWLDSKLPKVYTKERSEDE